MKKNVSVVIGLNYGDECKGSMTDYLAHKAGNDVAVVRFSGGANAGHTVQLPDGTRHVFHHIGAGAFTGATTILSKFFIVNPVLFFNEIDELAPKVDVPLHVVVDPEAYVTTPYDIFLNQAIEKSRGKNRHGSCGVGLGETLERVEQGFPLQVKDLYSSDLLDKLMKIKHEYFYKRLDELQLQDDIKVLAEADARFIADAREFVEVVDILPDYKSLREFSNLVFEGSQGLSLDQCSEDFPHVTRTNTGLKNVAALLKLFNKDDVKLNIHYLTRSYLTRHGAGPLNNELKESISIIDVTNQPNDHQGSLRFAPLDFGRIKRNVKKDLQHIKGFEYNVTGVVTCCNQSEEINTIPVSDIVEKVAESIGTSKIITSFGFTRNNIID